MSVESTLAVAGNDIKGFFTKLKADLATAKAIWNIIDSPQTRSLVITLSQQVITTVKDATTAIAADGVNFTIDAELVKDIQTLVADAKAGDAVIVADLKALGITL